MMTIDISIREEAREDKSRLFLFLTGILLKFINAYYLHRQWKR